jgi:D-glycero-D-manno-heptose 1,7-bisphosphate phosphatase
MNKAVFLDRDGVINRKAPEGGYIVRWLEFEILPGVVEAIRILNQAAYRVIVVTNQRAVAKNKITLTELEEIHRKLIAEVAQSGAVIDRVYFCPHNLENKCGCRKPEPGMLLRALEELEIDPQQSWMIGDGAVDIEAGRRAGCRTALVRAAWNGTGGTHGADILAEDLYQAVEIILRTETAVPVSAGL